MRLNSIFFISLMLLTACSSQPAKVKIASVPDGAVITSHTSAGSKILGKTPVEIESSSLPGEGRFNSLTLTKEGHEEHHLLLARDRGTENYDINITLKTQGDDPKVMDARARQEKLAKLLLQAHSMTAAKKYPDADRVLGTLQQEYPNVSAVHDLMGNLAYMQRDLKTALKHYERSLQINAENAETKLMVDRLKGMIQ